MRKKCKEQERIWKKLLVILSVMFVFVIGCESVYASYVMTYLYGTGDYIEMISQTENILNEVSPSYFDIESDGSLKVNFIDKSLITEMHNKNIKVVPFLSNHWNREARKKGIRKCGRNK